MILIKYIVREAFKNQLIVLIILFLVCLCQKFIKMLNLFVDGNVSIYLIFMFIGLSIPELSKLIIPFSVFISVPITFYRLHMHNEILAIYICSIDKYIFIKSILYFAGIISVFSWINMLWLSPYCGYYQNKLLFELNKNVDLIALTEKKFQSLGNEHSVFFIENISKNKMKNIFLVRKNKEALTVIIANQGNICYLSDRLKLIILEKGICYEIYNKHKLCENIYVSKFHHYKTYLDRNFKILHKKNEISYMSVFQLLNSCVYEAHLELHWRLTLLISIIVMPIIATLLFVTIVPNYISCTIFLIFLYVTFFLLHILLRFYFFKNINNPIIWIWGINIMYIIVALVLNLWNSFYIKKLLFLIKRLYIKM